MATLQNNNNYNKTWLNSWVTQGYRKQSNKNIKKIIISLIQLLTEYIGKGSFMHTPYLCVCMSVK